MNSLPLMAPIIYSMRQESKGMMSPTPHYYMVEGRAAEIARAFESPGGGAEHLFLAMLHDGGWPVSVLASARLFDPEQVERADRKSVV